MSNISDYTFLEFGPTEKLIGTENYVSWRQVQTTFLDARDVLEVVTGKEPMPNDAGKQIEWHKKEKYARMQLAGNIDLSILSQFPFTSSQDLWTSLEKQFLRTGPEAQAVAIAALWAKRISSEEDMEDHVKALRRYRADLVNAGGSVSKMDWKSIVISSLTGKWSRYRLGFIAVDDGEVIISALILEAQRLKIGLRSP